MKKEGPTYTFQVEVKGITVTCRYKANATRVFIEQTGKHYVIDKDTAKTLTARLHAKLSEANEGPTN